MPARRLIMPLLVVIATAAMAASSAAAEETATLHASFSPNRLAAGTTILFGFSIASGEGVVPPPLSAVDLKMPAGLGYSTTTLGLAVCAPTTIEQRGLSGCPANSRLGFGSAVVEVPFGSGSSQELPELQVLMGPPRDGNLVVLFYANGLTPVFAQLVFSGEILPARGRYGSDLRALVPPIPSVPDGPDVAVRSVQATIGPRGLTYYRHRRGHLVGFRPVGVSVPERCPAGGFPFTAEFSFADGSHASASTKAPCPRHR